MPCYDTRSNNPTRTVYETGISPSVLDSEKRHRAWAEAAVCAICNELDRRGIAEEVLAESSRNGLIGLVDFWKAHSGSDRARLALELHKFSKDEQSIIRQLLNDTTK